MLCQQDNETTIHTLWSCPTTSDVFANNYSSLNKWLNYFNDKHFLSKLATKLDKLELEWVAVILRNV